jgi:branched-chain amino acid transport system substrate-binding protein
MRKWFCLLLAMLILAAAIPLTGCGSKSSEVIKIGALLDNSAGNKPLGDAEKLALEMMQEQINADGGIDGREIEIVFRDYGQMSSLLQVSSSSKKKWWA